MMITCPKCQFTQPKDRYCANCGVDIENYKPKPQPLLKTLWNNTGFQIGLMVALVLLISVAVIKKVRKSNIENQVSYEEFDESTNVDAMATASEFRQNKIDTQMSDSKPRADIKAESAPVPTKNSKANLNKEAPKANAQEPAPTPQSVNLQFGHLSRSSLESISDEHQNIGDGIDVYVIENGPKKFSTLQADANSYFPFGGSESALFDSSLPISNNHMVTNPETNDEIGFTYTLSKRVISPEEIQWTLRLSYFLPQPETGEVANFSTEENFTSSSKSTILLANIFKGLSLGDKELSQFQGTPLGGLGVAEYLSKEADLVLFIDFQ